MEIMNEVQREVAKEIEDITSNAINRLTGMWLDTFEVSICKDNVKKLTEHVSCFYDEIMAETVQKQESIKEDIAKLYEEGNTLRRLLNVKISLSPRKGVPLFTARQELDDNLKDLREILRVRRCQIYELLLEQEALCDELCEPPKQLLDDPLPTEEEIQDFRLHLDALKAEKVNRQYEVSTVRREIKALIVELGITFESGTEIDLLSQRTIPLTKENIAHLREMHSNYVYQIEEIRTAIATMKTKLEVLWDCLDTSPSTREKFKKYTNYSQITYDKYCQELERCENKKRQNVKMFVDKIREEIVVWWEKTLKSDLERSRFSNFTNDCYTEDLLTLHEMELEDLKRFYNNNAQIFELFAERKVLWDKMIELEECQNKPGRYNNRGGLLLKEEKERKKISFQLPNIEEKIQELVQKFETENNRQFLVHGRNILELMNEEWIKRREEKEKLMSARKHTPRSQKNAPNTRTPLSVKNHSTIKKTISSTNLSSMPSAGKRKLQASENITPNAKRNLLSDFKSPNKFLKPSQSTSAFKQPKKSPAKKFRVISTTINRRSSRTSNGSRNRRKSIRKRIIPEILVTDEAGTSDSMSYDMFEENMAKDPMSRSSMVQCSGKKKKLPDPRLVRTQSKHKNIDHSALRSPALSRTGSPAIGATKLKLSTRNFPNLF